MWRCKRQSACCTARRGDCLRAHNKMDRPETHFPAFPLKRVARYWAGLENSSLSSKKNAAREPFFSALSKSSYTKRRLAHYFPRGGIEFLSKSTSTSGINKYFVNVRLDMIIFSLPRADNLKFSLKDPHDNIMSIAPQSRKNNSKYYISDFSFKSTKTMLFIGPVCRLRLVKIRSSRSHSSN